MPVASMGLAQNSRAASLSLARRVRRRLTLHDTELSKIDAPFRTVAGEGQHGRHCSRRCLRIQVAVVVSGHVLARMRGLEARLRLTDGYLGVDRRRFQLGVAEHAWCGSGSFGWLNAARMLGNCPRRWRRLPLVHFAVVARSQGLNKVTDVLTPHAQQRHSFTVSSLPISTTTSHQNLYRVVDGQRLGGAYEERLPDNRQTPVPEQVAFRCDFPAWLRTSTPRDRRIIEDMSSNERTTNWARRVGVSRGRISQFRRQYQEDWHRFVGDRDAK
jgi:hypothetical protein